MILLWFKHVPEGSIYYIFISGVSSFSKTLINHQSFAKEIWRCHRKVREFEKLDFKYRKVLLDIDFLNTSNTCLKKNMAKCVQFRVSNKDLRNSMVYRQCQIKLLKRYPTRKEIWELKEEV